MPIMFQTYQKHLILVIVNTRPTSKMKVKVNELNAILITEVVVASVCVCACGEDMEGK